MESNFTYTHTPQWEMCAVIRSGQIPLEWSKCAYVVHMGTVNTDTSAYMKWEYSGATNLLTTTPLCSFLLFNSEMKISHYQIPAESQSQVPESVGPGLTGNIWLGKPYL